MKSQLKKAKPAVRRGRKATGLYEIAGLPGRRQLGFFIGFGRGQARWNVLAHNLSLYQKFADEIQVTKEQP